MTRTQALDTNDPAPASRPRSRRRLVIALALLTSLILVLALAHRPLLVGFAHLFRVDDPAPADALVLLVGGESDRPLKAAELYHRGMAPVILMGQTSDTRANQRVLTSEGVPAEAIRILGPVDSTRDEALRVRDYARSHPLKSVTVVTTAFHSARARWIFRRVLRDQGITVHVSATEDARFNESTWYRSEAGRKYYVREFIKLFYYRIVY